MSTIVFYFYPFVMDVMKITIAILLAHKILQYFHDKNA